jgi:cytochrome c
MSNKPHTMQILRQFFGLICVVAVLWACSSEKKETRVLVFSKTAGFRHQSIEEGIAAIQKLGQQHGFLVDTTEDASNFTEENLQRYQAVIFLNTTGDVLNGEQQNDFERFVQAGGGFVGVHAAADTEYGWPWYGKLVGAYFESHPNGPNVRKGVFQVVDKGHPATDSLPERWEREDEFYNFKKISPDIKVLVKIDEKSYQGGTNGDNHPMSWYQEFDGGRAFYTSLGHTDESFSEPLYLKHLWGGISYVLGGDTPRNLDYKLAKSERVPEENRFTKVVLDEKLDEPTEMAVLKDGRVLFVQRKGDIRLYTPGSGTKTIAKLSVSTKYNPDKAGKQKEAEDGVLGLQLDPNFDQNHWVYIYFSPEGTKPINTLCRFEMKGDEIDLNSKKVILEVPVQRDECCHTGGSIAFDGKGNLFLSTGDNTNPFASNGYSPSDEQSGRSAWDAQRSSGNTNDLRGKILRIHPESDGSYTIPEGNLFPKGTPNTRPEIYVMGNRNPYRISVDPKTGFLYWGEVGPDANKDTVNRGPRGHDEVNQARKAGNFGWPHFVGDNKAYVKYDFATGKSGEKFDAAKPMNTSPNNTGMQQLPPANKAFIWYPYAESEEFPLVGAGGRNAMAGPVFYKEDFANAKRAFPDYFHGKLFAYDWIRGWIMAVSMDKEGNFEKMERFMPSHKFSNPIDMQFGPDGDLYVLEYGAGWFKQNDDARLVRIEYNGGNRKPVVQIAADKTVGATPLTVNFSSKGTKDFDRDKLTYEWSIGPKGGGTQKKLTEENPSFTFDKPGVYRAVLTVTDAKGEKTTGEATIEAGNEPPQLSFDITNGNRTFFFPNQSFDYAVKVSDKEDGSLENGSISPDQVAVNIDYMKEGFDQIEVVQGHRQADASVSFANGKNLIEKSDCKACHGIDTKSIGPAYTEVAKKYKGDKEALGRLANKIIKGGGGVWGENVMSAHPQHTLAQTTEMVSYILSLGDNKAKGTSLPIKGSYTTKVPTGEGDKGAFVLRASYTDKGANSIEPMTSEQMFVLKNPNVSAATASKTADIMKYKVDNVPFELMIGEKSGSYIAFSQIDLTGINQMAFSAFALKDQTSGGKLEIHLGSPTGQLLGETPEIVALPMAGKAMPAPQVVKTAIAPTTGQHDIYLVYKKDNVPAGQALFALLTVHFQNDAKGATAPKTAVSMK